ncbi:hypothetical protein DW973_07510 [Parabacteroides merdae]|jgi:hypothetical protein|nr:hypothetical protein DXB85_00320 [Parabacteroides merdae]RGZ78839.1 hypothetical protein DW973_07510 [Parabacteroides merdae]
MQLTANSLHWLSNNKLIPYIRKAASVKKGGLFVLTRKRIFVRIKTEIAMRKLIYFPIASLMAVTGKSRPQGKQAG